MKIEANRTAAVHALQIACSKLISGGWPAVLTTAMRAGATGSSSSEDLPPIPTQKSAKSCNTGTCGKARHADAHCMD